MYWYASMPRLRFMPCVWLAAIVLVGLSIAAPTAAQTFDFEGIQKQREALSDAGDHKAALKLAQKLETAVKAQFGPKHPYYAAALEQVAAELLLLQRFKEAEATHKRAIAILEKNPGPNQSELITALKNLAFQYWMQGRLPETEPLRKRVLVILQQEWGPQHPLVAEALIQLAELYGDATRFDEAIALYARAQPILDHAFGANHAKSIEAVVAFATLLARRGRYRDAEEPLARALASIEAAPPQDQRQLAHTLNVAAVVYTQLGRYGEAERIYRRILTFRDDPMTLADLAGLYIEQERFNEAEKLLQGALASLDESLPNFPLVVFPLNTLGYLYRITGRLAEAEQVYRRALKISEQPQSDSNGLSLVLNNLAVVLRELGRFEEAADMLRRSIALDEKAFGAGHPGLAGPLGNLADIYRLTDRPAEAEPLYKRALALIETSLGPTHKDVIMALQALGLIEAGRGNLTAALGYFRRSTAAVLSRARSQVGAGQATLNDESGAIGWGENFFIRHVEALAAATRAEIEPTATLADEAVVIAQWARQSVAAAAVQQIGARFASSTDVIAALVREQQDLAAAWQEKSKVVASAVAKGNGPQAREEIQSLIRETSDIEGRAVAVAARIEREFPEYANLANPKSLKPAELCALLGSQEALVFWLAGHNESYVFAFTHEGFMWQSIPADAQALEQKVAAFRRELDVDALERGLGRVAAGHSELFDLALAHELYETLLGPAEALIKDKRHLIVVPAGALTALPFHLLVTEKPAVAVSELKTVKDLAAYRDAAWLLKRHAISVLPSIASLKALRVFARKGEGTKPMIGFGDPVFDPDGLKRPPVQRVAGTTGVNTRGYAEFWQGAGIERARLAQLPRLPDTADELRTVAQKLGAPLSDVHLGTDASETMVKRLPLADYRVVYFATHGLVAGAVEGLGEPSLALTLPAQLTAEDDGLLTASEVAQLTLNADWVVLSACNTIAGEKPGAEALSGLARAFF
jgi:tetratricopeptide (TPR) repeat protein